MIGLFCGDGGGWRRLVGEVVPCCVGALGGWFAGALLGLPAGLGVGVGLALGLSAVLVVVRRRPLLRRIYRLALLAHVLFWSWQGLAAHRLAPPGPVSAAQGARWDGPQTFRAGVSEASFDLTQIGTLSGWGQPPRRLRTPPWLGVGPLGRLSLGLMAERDAQGVARAPLFAAPAEPGDALGARALVLRPDGGGPPLVFVRLDLTTSDTRLHEALLARVSDLGVTAPLLVLSATHTHSGLSGYSRDVLGQVLALDHFDPEVFERIVDAASAAVRRAFTQARPARLTVGEARDRGPDGVPVLARRRGNADFDDIDDRVVGLRVEADEGRTLALLVNHAVHPVAVRREHMAFDRDVAGAIEEQLGWRLPGHPLVLFVNGALGDVSPRVVRSATAPDALLRAGERFADAVAPGLLAGTPLERLEVRAARVTRDLGSPWTFVALGDRGRYIDQATPSPFDGALEGVLADALLLPANATLWSLGFTDLRVAGSVGGALGVQASLGASLTQREQAVGAVVLSASRADGSGVVRLPILWVPCEATTALGRAWRRAFAAPGGPTPMIIGLANGSMAYATSAAEQRAGGYEASATLYGPATETLLTESLRAALQATER